jgi:polar amino acid transport system substrate-binding protein
MRTIHRFIAAISALLIAACAASPVAPSPQEKRELVPAGHLRVGIFLSDLYALKDPATGELRGMAVDLGKDLARQAGVPMEVVGYPTVAALIDGASDQWDVAFLTINPQRLEMMEFSAPFAEIEIGYLVPPHSTIGQLSEVDRPGIRVAVARRGTPDTRLSATLAGAVLLRAPSQADAVELLRSGKADAFASNKTYLAGTLERFPGSRILEGRIAVEPVAIAVPKGKAASAAYVRKFVEAAKSDGRARSAIERAGLFGVVVAPPP